MDGAEEMTFGPTVGGTARCTSTGRSATTWRSPARHDLRPADHAAWSEIKGGLASGPHPAHQRAPGQKLSRGRVKPRKVEKSLFSRKQQCCAQGLSAAGRKPSACRQSIFDELKHFSERFNVLKSGLIACERQP